jgi:hypothetical protein
MLVALSISAFSQEKTPTTPTESCRAAVVDFYGWYGGKALKHNRITDPEGTVKAKPNLFGRELRQELISQFRAQDKAGNDLVSLDGDPFTGPDGPADRYIVKQVKVNDGKCRAEVYGVRNGKQGASPEVKPELEFQNSQWRFGDFYFPGTSDSKWWSVKAQLRASRQKQEAPNDHK